MTSSLTILRCQHNRRATKLIQATDESVTVAGYDAGMWFAASAMAVAGIENLGDGLDAVAADTRAFVIRGELLPGVNPSRVRRLLHEHEDGGKPAFREVARPYVILDYDGAAEPPGWDWRDGVISALHLRAMLPDEFHDVGFWWGFSSSAGFKPGLRMKLAFWLDRPVTGAELGRWLAAAPVDHAVFRPVQPCYVARPLLFGVPDPVPDRTGLEMDRRDAVRVPDIPAPPDDAPGSRGGQWREMPAASAGWPLGVLEEVAQAIATTPPSGRNRWHGGGRHHALFCGSLRVSGLIAEGFLESAGAVRTLAAAATHAGIAEVEAARTIRNAFRQGGLPA